MSWRTVIISNQSKLDCKMGYMVVRGEETKRIFLDEIAVVIVEHPAVSLTSLLLAAFAEKKIKLIFCDKKRNPCSEMVPLYGCFDCSSKLKRQIAWTPEQKGAVWTIIVAEKIKNQAALLKQAGKSSASDKLYGYISQLEFADSTNREGHAAKVYFNALFGMDFSRNTECKINSALDYGYSLILSAVNREVVSNGYLTQLGLWHDNKFNFFNLSCDLMEPFRPFIDRFVYFAELKSFDTPEKRELVRLLHADTYIDGAKQTLLNAVKIYVQSVFNALNEQNHTLIKFADYEL